MANDNVIPFHNTCTTHILNEPQAAGDLTPKFWLAVDLDDTGYCIVEVLLPADMAPALLSAFNATLAGKLP